MDEIKKRIEEGRPTLGIEFGSTRVKAVLVDETFQPIASGNYRWENQLVDGYWTYSLEEIITGLQESYQNMVLDVQKKYGVVLTKIGAIGFSAMMHGYMAFDKEDNLLVPFRTWRNSTTEKAAAELTKLFGFNIPERWSIAHLYQAILNEEDHVKDISYITTLAGYLHWRLTGEKVIGIGDASGMFPIDVDTKQYDQEMIAQFEQYISEKDYSWHLSDVLPKILLAGEQAGVLTEKGAKLLDPSGTLLAGIPLCPPEGDAGTGMVATNSVRVRTGNVSAGTSAFAMVVLDKPIEKVYPEIDIVTTPTGEAVAMVHTNNCTSDINAWIEVFGETLKCFGVEATREEVFDKLFRVAMAGDADCGGLLSYGYYSGENITKLSEGRPLFVRTPESKFTLANFMRMHLTSALGALKVGMDILLKQEKVNLEQILAHGGYFTTKDVGQKLLAAALGTPVSVMETAGEGGPWGMAILARYMIDRGEAESLAAYLDHYVFAEAVGSTEQPDPDAVKGFETFIASYKQGLGVEQKAVEIM